MDMTDNKEIKSIEYCLDELLKELKKNWDDHGRLHLDGEGFLKKVGYPIRLEYFKEMIDVMIEHGYVRHRNDRAGYATEYKWYEGESIITARGLFFISNGGYQQRLLEEKSYSARIASLETKMFRVTFVAAFATGGLLLLEIVKWTVSRLDLVFCTCK
jgi:hypothetical protein